MTGKRATQKEMFRDVMIIVILLITMFFIARILGFM